MARVNFPTGVHVDCAVSEVAGVIASGGELEHLGIGDKLREAVHLGRMDRDEHARALAERYAQKVLDLRAHFLEDGKIYWWIRKAVAAGQDRVVIAADTHTDATAEAIRGIPGLTATTGPGYGPGRFSCDVTVRW